MYFSTITPNPRPKCKARPLGIIPGIFVKQYEKAIPPKYETREKDKKEGKGDEGKKKGN
jgi:hypothetical protein